MAELTNKHSLIVAFFNGGWHRWLPMPAQEMYIAICDLSVDSEERLYDDNVIARMLDPRKSDIHPNSDRLRTLSEESEESLHALPFQVMMKMLSTRYPRSRGDLLQVMEKLRLIRRLRSNGSESWRVCEPLPSVLDLRLPDALRAYEMVEQNRSQVLVIITRPNG